jgi:hypothetical protein
VLGVVLNESTTRWRDNVRSAAALRRRVHTHRGNQLLIVNLDRINNGGLEHKNMALSDDTGRTDLSRVVPFIPDHIARLFRFGIHQDERFHLESFSDNAGFMLAPLHFEILAKEVFTTELQQAVLNFS